MITSEEIEQLYRLHYRRMYIVARTLLSDDAGSADVVNDVFADILAGKTILPQGCSDGWWVVTVRNRCLTILRQRTVRQRVESQLALDADTDTTQTERQIVSQIDREQDHLDQVNDFIDSSLTPQTRRILLMHYRERKKYREIATELDISETAVYKHLAKAIRQLKEQFTSK